MDNCVSQRTIRNLYLIPCNPLIFLINEGLIEFFTLAQAYGPTNSEGFL